jgi:hypothetical protein
MTLPLGYLAQPLMMQLREKEIELKSSETYKQKHRQLVIAMTGQRGKQLLTLLS